MGGVQKRFWGGFYAEFTVCFPPPLVFHPPLPLYSYLLQERFLRRARAVCIYHVYLNSVQQMVSGELAEECLQTGFERHGLPSEKAPLDTVYPLRELLNSVQRTVSRGYCEGLFPDTGCWTRLRNTWYLIQNRWCSEFVTYVYVY